MTASSAPPRFREALAVLGSVGLLLACTRIEQSPQRKGASVQDNVPTAATLELKVLGDPIQATAGASFVVPVRLRNVGAAPVALMFTSSCSFRIAIATTDGREVARPEQLCMSVIREPELAPGETIEDSVSYTMGEPGVVRLEPGTYRVTPVLLSLNRESVAVHAGRVEVRRPAAGGGAEESKP